VHLLREGSARNPKSETLRPAPDGEIGVIVAGLTVLRLTASSFGKRSGVVLVDHPVQCRSSCLASQPLDSVGLIGSNVTDRIKPRI
jgi:hypothetical protein